MRRLFFRIFGGCCVFALQTCSNLTDAATVSWVGGSGDWTNAACWSTGALPGSSDDVVIGTPSAITVTHSVGTHQVHSIKCQEAFVLSGGTLTVTTAFLASNTVTLYGGTLQSTTLTTSNAVSVVVEGQGSTLNAVTINGVLDVGSIYNAAGLTITNGLILNGTALIGNSTNGNDGELIFAGTQTFGGNGTVVFGNNSNSGYNAIRPSLSGTTLTIGPGITIDGQNGLIGYASAWGGSPNVTIINQGTVAQTVGGGTINFAGSLLVNQSNISAIVKGGALNISCNLTNAGTIYATNVSVTLGGSYVLNNLGSFMAGGTTVFLTGTLTNSGTILSVNGLGRLWILNGGGTILGGTVLATNGASLIIGSGGATLNGVTLNGALDVGNYYNNVGVNITNGLVLNGTALVGNPTNSANGGLSFYGTQSLTGSGTVVFGNCSSYSYNTLRTPLASSTLTIGTGITVTGQNGVIGYASAWGGSQSVTVINQGVIAATLSSGSIGLAPSSFVNNGMVKAIPGNLALNAGFNNSGGTIVCGLSNTNVYGQVQVSGTAALGGTLSVIDLGTFSPAISNAFPVVTYGSYSGAFATVNLPSGPVWQTKYSSTNLVVTVADTDFLQFVTNPAIGTAGATLSSVVVQVVDAATGNPVARSGLSITVLLGSGSGILSGTVTRTTDATGKATFNDLSINLAGTKTLFAEATSGGMTPVTSTSLVITAAHPTQLALVSAISSPQQNQMPFSPAPVVQVLDQFGNIVSNSTVLVSASATSTGNGMLYGTTGANADGATGSAKFTSLEYNLGRTNTIESVVVHFTSPGLTSVSSQPVLVDYIYHPFALTNGNSIVQIDPTTQNGISSWIVDGEDDLFQKWYWLAEGSSSPVSVDAWSPSLGMTSVSSNVATIIYSAQGLQVTLNLALAGGSPGSQKSTLNENISITNTSSSSITLHFYQYLDFDLDGQPTNDSIFFPAANSVVQFGNGAVLSETVQTSSPNEREASWYALTLDELTGGTSVNLSDQILVPSVGDQTFAFQWDRTLAAGSGFVISTTSIISPPSGVPSLSLLKTNAIISWPTNYSTTAQLQSCTNLAGGLWSNVTNATTVTNGSLQVMLPIILKGSTFYRLH